MKISEISIRNNVFAWMLMAFFIIFGALSFSRMGISQLPEVDLPMVNISVGLDNASPEIMELDIVDVIEEALTSVQGVKSITSSSRLGNANITVEFGINKDIDVAVQEVQSALSRIMRRLPNDIQLPSVRKSNPEDNPILWLSISSDSVSKKDLMNLVRNQIQDKFSTIEGVGEITLSGYLEPNLRVWLSQEKLNKFELTASDVISTIQREHAEKPGGRIETPEKEFNIRTLGEAPTVKAFSEISVSRRGGGVNFAPIPLSSVATVEEGTEDQRTLSRANGNPSIGLGIRKQPGSNSVEVAREIKARVKEISAQLPPGVEMAVRFDATTYIEESIKELNFTLILSAILTSFVCWLFLGSWSATLNVLLAIPTSVVGSFIILNYLGFTLNTFTLLGLSLAIGIVVDDAIMVLENIVRHKEKGKSKLLAALDGSVEITSAAIAATAAIVAIFLPVAFMSGIIGKYFLQFGITLSVAVLLSLIEALTLTPMRCSRFLDTSERSSFIGKKIEQGFEKSAAIYKMVVSKTLNFPMTTVIASIVFFVLSLFVAKFIKQEFVPAQDQGRLMIRMQTPVGSSLPFTDQKLKQLEKIVSDRPEVEAYFSSVGGMGTAQVNLGMVFLTLKPRDQRKLSAQQLIGELRNQTKIIKDARITIQDPSLSAFAARRGFPIEFSIRGPEWSQLIDLTEKVTKAMEESGLMTDVDTNYQAGLPEIQIVPDRIKAKARGVEISEIAQTVNVMMASALAGKYSKGGRRYDVRVGLPPEERTSKELIPKIFLRNDQGELVLLSDVATLTEKTTLQSISREDRQRAIGVYANVANKSSQAEALAAVQEIGKKILPPGYILVTSGSSKTFKESMSGLLFALFFGILISYMVLASQFNSFIHPITILIALPFSISGALLALLIFNQSLNIYSMIGIILLMGIVKKNSILLVEFTTKLRESGKSPREALIEACPIRLRPILMTSIATIVGAIPPALAIGPGAESRIPMALAVIGGVTVSTVLTLIVVPCFYSLMSRFESKDSTFAALFKLGNEGLNIK